MTTLKRIEPKVLWKVKVSTNIGGQTHEWFVVTKSARIEEAGKEIERKILRYWGKGRAGKITKIHTVPFDGYYEYRNVIV